MIVASSRKIFSEGFPIRNELRFITTVRLSVSNFAATLVIPLGYEKK
jgi:hypothetical protein